MNPRKVIEILGRECQAAPERVPGYRKALNAAASGVIWEEYEHTIKATTIQQKVSGHCDALGEFLAKLDTGADTDLEQQEDGSEHEAEDASL